MEFLQLARKAFYRLWVTDLISFAVSSRELEEILRSVRKNGIWNGLLPDYSGYKGVGYYRDIQPVQDCWELQSLANMVRKNGAERVLEIGTLNGGTLLLWCLLAAIDATIVSIDLPMGSKLGAYEIARKKLYGQFALEEQELVLLRGDSHAPSMSARVKEILRDGQFDFIFIDGDHSYDGVRSDFQMYAPLCRPGGIVAFHDIREHPVRSYCDVHTFWSELKEKGEHELEEILAPAGKFGGIGVVHM